MYTVPFFTPVRYAFDPLFLTVTKSLLLDVNEYWASSNGFFTDIAYLSSVL